MNSVIWIFCILVFVLIIMYWLGGKFTGSHKISELEIPINSLLNRGLNGAYVSMTEKNSKLQVRIRKFIDSIGREELVIIFPFEPISNKYIYSMKEYLNNKKIEYEIQGDDLGTLLECLYINCGNDAKFCFDVVSDIFRKVFNVGGDSTIHVKATGIKSKALSDKNRRSHEG